MITKKGRLLVSITLLLLLFCFSTSVYADGNDTISEMFKQDQPQDNPTPTPPIVEEGPDSPSFGALLIRTFLILSLILLLIYGLSKWISKRGNVFEANQFIRIQSGVNLGQNKSLRLVKVGSSYYLLGVGNDISLLKEFTSEEEINEIELLQQSSSEKITYSTLKLWKDFRALFQKKEDQQGDSFQSQLEERLTGLRSVRQSQPFENHRIDKQQNRGELDQ